MAIFSFLHQGQQVNVPLDANTTLEQVRSMAAQQWPEVANAQLQLTNGTVLSLDASIGSVVPTGSVIQFVQPTGTKNC